MWVGLDCGLEFLNGLYNAGVAEDGFHGLCVLLNKGVLKRGTELVETLCILKALDCLERLGVRGGLV